MTIWLIGAVLVALAALLGFFLGAIRAAVSLVGAIVSAALAATVGGWVSGLVPMLGFKNPLWMFYLPPLFGFLIGSFVFLVIALVVHHLVERQSRNSTDEYSFARWERLNRRAGIAVGAGVGAVWLVLFSMVAYVPGYLATQLADSEESYGPLRWANSITHDMEQTGLSRLVERFNPAGADHYLASDIVGLVYHNPAIQSRLANYPPFLGLGEKTEIAELKKDPEVLNLIQSKAGLQQILEHPRIQAVGENADLFNELLALDLSDLEGYLRTGVSSKYKDERILGRWRLNVRRSIAEMKLVPSEKLPAVEFNLLRKALNVYLEDLTIGFATDSKAYVKVKAKDEQKLLRTLGNAAPASVGGAGGAGADATGGAEAGGDPGGAAPRQGGGLTARSLAQRAIPQAPPSDPSAEILRNRYGVNPSARGGGGARGGTGGGGGGTVQPLLNSGGAAPVRVAAPKPPTTTTLAPLMNTGEGGWSKAGEAYKVTISKDGKELALEAVVKENQLVATQNGRTLVFDRL